MNDSDEELRKAVALFRCGLIADVLRLAPGSADIRRTLHHKAQRTYTIPGTRRTRVAVETTLEVQVERETTAAGVGQSTAEAVLARGVGKSKPDFGRRTVAPAEHREPVCRSCCSSDLWTRLLTESKGDRYGSVAMRAKRSGGSQ